MSHLSFSIYPLSLFKGGDIYADRGGLWESSFHKVIPVISDKENCENWAPLRELFIASLFKRKKAEIDLWPSQLEGAKRAINDLDDLVVSLPTSAGKTRIAELCILRCLAMGKRVLFITPLRALSAQTEASLRETFTPLGKSVSSLYGSIGTSSFDQNVIRTQDIVVGTPEKVDFALRNDPSLINDVGLVVLDEGHMIGINEREISYEVQIQRLLKRKDAELRRIVCLSAILPSGDQLKDFVGWLRRDKKGQAIESMWRPTDLRFGEIIWHNNTGKINFKIGDEDSFIPNFIKASVPPIGKRKKEFPKDKKELTLAVAWKLVNENHTVLIYCSEKRSVNAYAKDILLLNKQGAIDQLLSVTLEELEPVIALGEEWLGCDHPIVKCLKIGVAIHHASLPTAFRKVVEKLIRDGIFKITISSPTLAQGLNLSATAIILFSIKRYDRLICRQKCIDISEFKNVIGRAGRAFVDTHGLVLYPIFKNHENEMQVWRSLVEDTGVRNMESGLFMLVQAMLDRIVKSAGSLDENQLVEYVLNNTQAWTCPIVAEESPKEVKIQKTAWNHHIVNLDKAILSMLGENDIPITEIASAIGTVLQSSLWQRRLNRKNEDLKLLYNSVLVKRAERIWNLTTTAQRKGYFLAGVGLDTGKKLDVISPQANELLIKANGNILNNQHHSALENIIKLAGLLFEISPFTPKELPGDWKRILTAWLVGKEFSSAKFEKIDKAIDFLQNGLIYHLTWGLEAIRVRAQTNQDAINDGTGVDTTIDCYEVGLLVPAIEYGSLNISAVLLMQMGLNSRKLAIDIVNSTNASFQSKAELNAWLNSTKISSMRANELTPESLSTWVNFLKDYEENPKTAWASVNLIVPVNWVNAFTQPIYGSFVKLWNSDSGKTQVLASDGELIGVANDRFKLLKTGVYSSKIHSNINYLDVTYFGVESNPFDLCMHLT